MIQSGKWSIGLVLVMAASVASAAEKYDLTIRFSEGKTQYIEVVSDITQEMKMPGGAPQGMPTKTTFTTINGMVESIESATKEGTTIKLKFDRQAFDMAVPMMGKQEYDSDQGVDSGSSMLKQIFAPMIGKEMTLKLDENNKVVSFTGMDEIRKEVNKSAGANPMAQQMTSQMTDEVAQATWGDERFAFVPSKPVAIGDSWTVNREQDVPNLGKLIFEAKYTLDDVRDVEYEGKKREAAIISFKGTIKSGGAAPQAGPGGMTPEIKDGTQEGVIHLDMKRHRVLTRQSQGTMNLAMKNPMGAMDIVVTTSENTKTMPMSSREKQRKTSEPKEEDKESKSDSND